MCTQCSEGHEHHWPTKGELHIEKCERVCQYCVQGYGPPSRHPSWQSTGANGYASATNLRNHVKVIHLAEGRSDFPDVFINIPNKRRKGRAEVGEEVLNVSPQGEGGARVLSTGPETSEGIAKRMNFPESGKDSFPQRHLRTQVLPALAPAIPVANLPAPLIPAPSIPAPMIPVAGSQALPITTEPFIDLPASEPGAILARIHNHLHLVPSVQAEFRMLILRHVLQTPIPGVDLDQIARSLDPGKSSLPRALYPVISSFLQLYGSIIWPIPETCSCFHLTPFTSLDYTSTSAMTHAQWPFNPVFSMHGIMTPAEQDEWTAARISCGQDAELAEDEVYAHSKLGKLLQAYVVALLSQTLKDQSYHQAFNYDSHSLLHRILFKPLEL